MSLFNKLNLNKFISFAILTIPIFLIFSIAFINLICLILTIFLIYKVTVEKKFHIFKNIFIIFFILFSLIIIISSLISENYMFSLKSSLLYFRFTIISLATYIILIENKKFLNFFFLSLFICFGILIIDSLFQFYMGFNVLGYYSSSSYRVSSFFNDEQILGSYISRLSPLFFGLMYYLYSEIKYFKTYNFLLISVFFLIIILSGERVALVYFFIFISAYLFFIYQFQLLKIISFFLFASLLILVFLNFSENLKYRIIDYSYNQLFYSFINQKHVQLMTNSPFTKIYTENELLEKKNNYLKNCSLLKNCKLDRQSLDQIYIKHKIILNAINEQREARLDDRVKHFFKKQLTNYKYIYYRGDNYILYKFDLNTKLNIYIKETKDIILISPEHNALIRTAYNIFLDNYILGVGPRMFRLHCDNPDYAYNSITFYYSGCSTSPHNIYMQVLAEIGIIGLIFVLLFFISLIYILIKNLIYNSKNKIRTFENILIICFLLNLFPLFPTGNFFGNWINIIMYMPLPFFLYLREKNDN